MNIEAIGNIKLSEDFKEIVHQFELEFKENGFYKLASYMGFDDVVEKDEVRGYELVPFEANLIFNTGSNGEHMGWLNLLPKSHSAQRPFICWVPLGAHIFYHGIDGKEILANSIEQIHSNEYQDIDLEFLGRIGVQLGGAKKALLINYDDEVLAKIPIEIPLNYRYEITADGVGVITKKEYFSEEATHQSKDEPFEKLRELSFKYLSENYFGSALFFLKEAYYRYYFKASKEQLIEILKMKEKAYKAIEMHEVANEVHREITRRTS